MEQINTKISDRYLLIKILGQGSHSSIYLAYDTRLERNVVIKIFKNNDEGAIVRIQKESNILASLIHPNIISILDVGYYNNSYYLVLENINGLSLKEYLSTHQLYLNLSLQFLRDIASAIHYIHSYGVIHRDIKPENIIIYSDSKNKTSAFLTDFSIAKKIENDFSITNTGDIIGTLGFMSPEQLNGKSVTTATDIYSFGIVAYKLLTGSFPFSMENINSITTSRNKKNIPVNKINNAINEELSNLVDGMLCYDAEERISAKAILNVLEKYQNYGNDIYINIEEQVYDGNTNAVLQKTIKVYGSTFPKEQTIIPQSKAVEPTGFFASNQERYIQFEHSVSFYREHLDKEYKASLKQANISFFLWVLCFSIGFIILGIGIYLLYFGKLVQGGLTVVTEVFIYFVQNLFRIREKYFRDNANLKIKHLEAGNYWALAAQSISAFGNSKDREEQLSKLIDNLNQKIKTG